MNYREFPLVIAVGGGGINTLDRLARELAKIPSDKVEDRNPWFGLTSTKFSVEVHGFIAPQALALNTRADSLRKSRVPQKFLLGPSLDGHGCNGNPELGAKAAQESLGELSVFNEELSVVLLLAGLGGGTGGGATPVIADAARDAGMLVIALVTLPFNSEGRRRREQAQAGVEELKKRADFVLSFSNDALVKAVGPRCTMQQAFTTGDEVFKTVYRTLGSLEQPVTPAEIYAALRAGIKPLSVSVELFAHARFEMTGS